MATVQFNKSGVSLIAYGSKGLYFNTMGAPEHKPPKVSSPQNYDPDKHPSKTLISPTGEKETIFQP